MRIIAVTLLFALVVPSATAALNTPGGPERVATSPLGAAGTIGAGAGAGVGAGIGATVIGAVVAATGAAAAGAGAAGAAAGAEPFIVGSPSFEGVESTLVDGIGEILMGSSPGGTGETLIAIGEILDDLRIEANLSWLSTKAENEGEAGRKEERLKEQGAAESVDREVTGTAKVKAASARAILG